MAIVTTSFTLDSDLVTWDSPGGAYKGARPFGEITFTDTSVVPVVGVGDSSDAVFTGTLPRNFAYRMVEIRNTLFASDHTEASVVQPGQLVTFAENQVTKKHIMIWRNEGNTSSQVFSTAVTNNQVNSWTPAIGDVGVFTDVIDASDASATFVWHAINTVADVAAVTWAPYVRFYVYTIEQYRSGLMWEPDVVLL